MGPIEISFLVMAVIFGLIGLVRGHSRELGATTMLLLGLLVIQLIEGQAGKYLNATMAFVSGPVVAQQNVAKALLWVAFLALIVFVSYEGETLSFREAARSPGLGLGVGLVNGYLFAGSVWYYLARVGWPYLNVHGPFSAFYTTALRVLPPNIFDWRYLIALVSIMLVLRVWR